MVLILINLLAAHTYTKEDDKRDQYFLCIGLPIIYKVTAKLRNAQMCLAWEDICVKVVKCKQKKKKRKQNKGEGLQFHCQDL